MVNGDIPFEADSQIKRADVIFRPELQLSQECKDLIRQCLNPNQSERISLKSIADHPWIRPTKKSDPLEDVTPAARVTLQRTLSQPVDVPAPAAGASISDGSSSNNNNVEVDFVDGSLDYSMSSSSSSEAAATPNNFSLMSTGSSFQPQPRAVAVGGGGVSPMSF